MISPDFPAYVLPNIILASDTFKVVSFQIQFFPTGFPPDKMDPHSSWSYRRSLSGLFYGNVARKYKKNTYAE